MVEAIGFGTTVIATENGATGLDTDLCGRKLIIVKDHDWKTFAKAVIEQSNVEQETPPQYYSYYYYPNVVKTAMNALNKN